MRLRLSLLILMVLVIGGMVLAQGDGIPDNCEAVPEHANEIIRYEPQNRRLVLVDWNTAQDIRVVASDLDNTLLLGWSISCRYIAGAVGSSESMDTVVWDVQTGERMGSVPDAHNQPHHITWGPNDYLVTETRNAAILWHVPTYQQTTLTTHFDPVTVRNFSRLRWDATNAQLIANIAGSGRVVYDLTTGQEVPQVAQRTDTYPGNAASQVMVGSAPYGCGRDNSYTYPFWYAPINYYGGLNLEFNPNTHQIYIDLYNSSGPEEVLVVLENDVSISSFQLSGWSADCRYVAAALGRIGSNTKDTYVWDVTTGQHVGILADAHEIPHPVLWHPSQPIILLGTRNGAVLWHLPSNRQILLDTGAETPLTGRRDVRNFITYAWSGDFLSLVPVNAPQSVEVYYVPTGALIANLVSLCTATRLSPSPTGAYIIMDCAIGQPMLWNRITGGVTQLPLQESRSGLYFSPTEHYLVAYVREGFYVWDLAALDAIGSPLVIHPPVWLGGNITFTDEVTMQGLTYQLNILTGELTPRETASQTPVSLGSLEGETGFSRYEYGCYRRLVYNGQISENPELHQYNIYDGSTLRLSFQARGYVQSSPDCRWVYAEVPYFTPNPHYDNAIVDDTYREQNSDYLVFWDTATGEAVRSFYHPYRFSTYSYISWSPDSNYAIVQTTEGAYLYHPSSDSATLLVFNSPDDAFSTRFRTYWDFERGFVLIGGWDAIYAFDLRTGVFLYEFTSQPSPSRCSYWGCSIRVIDQQYLAVNNTGTIGIWNLDTLESHFISTRVTPTWYRVRFSHLHVSPSGRFVIGVRRDGTMAVWDLQNLAPEINERLPYFVRLQNLGRGFEAVRFVDDTTVEILLKNGASYQLSLLRSSDQ
jgi:WD40 repeat protein